MERGPSATPGSRKKKKVPVGQAKEEAPVIEVERPPLPTIPLEALKNELLEPYKGQ